MTDIQEKISNAKTVLFAFEPARLRGNIRLLTELADLVYVTNGREIECLKSRIENVAPITKLMPKLEKSPEELARETWSLYSTMGLVTGDIIDFAESVMHWPALPIDENWSELGDEILKLTEGK